MNYTLIFFDTETTGNTAHDYLCQIAWKQDSQEIKSGLFKPPVPMSIESMAVCHITNKMVENMPAFKGSDLYHEFNDLNENPSCVFIAHNAPFDIQILKQEGIEIKQYIDTLKIARFLDKEVKIPKYNLQYLRYFYEIEVDAIAHDARGDIVVLEALFNFQKEAIREMLGDKTESNVIQKMINISYEPLLMKKFTFGKYIGKDIADVAKIDKGYLKWLLDQKEKSDSNTEGDWIYTLKHYLGEMNF